MITNNLFEEILIKNITWCDEINILSGYASANFLEAVHNIKPELKINLYIGMAREGITKYNHLKYIEMMKKFPEINVYYNIDNQLNHMKLYEFKSGSKKINYSGSANFSENGFKYNIENLIKVEFNLENYIDINKYKWCSDKIINEIIPIIDESLEESKVEDENIINIITNSDVKSERNRIINNKSYKNLLSKLRKGHHSSYIEKITFDIVWNNENRWSKIGINAKFNNNATPVFVSNGANRLNLFFDYRSDTFNIHTIYNETFKGRLNPFNRHFELIDGDLYEFIRREIKLADIRPISYNDLVKCGNTKVSIMKIDDDNYIMLFGEI